MAESTTHIVDTQSFISPQLLQRELQYQQRNEDLSKLTSNLLSQTQSAVKDGLQLLEQASNLPLPTSMDGILLPIHDSLPDSSTTVPTHSQRPIRSAPTGGNQLKFNNVTTTNTGTLRQPKVDEYHLIQKIADKLQLVVQDASLDYTLEATNRYLKARLLVMEEELDRVSQLTNSKAESISSTQSELKLLQETHKKLQKQYNQLQTTNDKLTAQLQAAELKASTTQTALTQAQRDLTALRKSEKSTSSEVHARETKLNRANEETERLRSSLTKAEQDRKCQIDKFKQANERLSIEIKRLEKQKSELLVGFRKQSQLIDVLRKQKLHLEAAKLLSFTEDEFTKLLDWC